MGSAKNLGLFSALTGEPMSLIAGGIKKVRDMSELPEAPELPPEVEEVDVTGQKQYTKKRLQSKKGRQSTILSGLGTSGGQNKKTVLG